MALWNHITIDRIEVRNFKRFYGTHTLDLKPLIGKPIILIGGDNGRGKTSIHEAINYALYEDDDLPGITTRPNYLRAISDRLNRRALDEGKTDFAVVLELLVSNGTAQRKFRIERSWEINPAERRVVRPHLQITENGRPVDWLDQDSPEPYQDFLRSTLPPQIAPFFFFDGERIQDFADDDNHSQRMIEAIEDILHINVYKSLRSDLKKYVVDYIEANEIAKTDSDDFFRFQQDAERIESELDTKRERLQDIDRESEDTSRERKRVEEELRRVASPHASRRDELLAERTRLETELEGVKSDILNAFESLPIMLAGRLVQDLQRTLVDEQGIHRSPQAFRQLKEDIERIEHETFDNDSGIDHQLRLQDLQRRVYREKFRVVSQTVLGLESSRVTLPLHDIAEGDRQRILARLDAVGRNATFLREGINRRERLFVDLRSVENKLQSTSDDEIVDKLIKQSRGLAERIGQLSQERQQTVGDIQRLESDLAVRHRQIEDRQRTRQATTEAKRVVRLGQEARRVLDVFIKRLANEKLESLRSRFEEMYGRLRKPEDPWRTVEIDRETWQIVLLDERKRRLERRVFSAGMKEIYALSLLWALSRASGRELPIVVDTPAGRLDTTNRRALFEKYLPNAGHQVIVLSTDTEVDVEWAKRLAPYVSHQFRLDYDDNLDRTVVRPGYFF